LIVIVSLALQVPVVVTAKSILSTSKASKGSAFDFILKLDSSVYLETAQHIKDAIASGKPSVVTIDRKGAAGRRKEVLK